MTFYDSASRRFVQKDVELPDEIRAVFANWQQYLADLFIGIAECSYDDDELQEISELIGFKYFDRTLAFVDEPGAGDWDADRGRKIGFIASLDP